MVHFYIILRMLLLYRSLIIIIFLLLLVVVYAELIKRTINKSMCSRAPLHNMTNDIHISDHDI